MKRTRQLIMATLCSTVFILSACNTPQSKTISSDGFATEISRAEQIVSESKKVIIAFNKANTPEDLKAAESDKEAFFSSWLNIANPDSEEKERLEKAESRIKAAESDALSRILPAAEE